MKQNLWAVVLWVLCGSLGAAWAQETPPADDTDSIPVKSESEKKDQKNDDDDDKKERDPRRKITYSSIGLTRASTDFDNLGKPINLSAVLGIRVPKLDIISAEIDLSTTLIPGENDGRTASSGGLGGGGGGGLFDPILGGGGGGGEEAQAGNFTRSPDDLLLNTIGVFGVLRSPGDFYAVGKYGFRYIQSTIQELQEEASGTAYVVGGGYRYGEDGGVELTYSKYSDFIDYFSLVVTYGFGGDDEEDKIKRKMDGEIVEDKIEDGIEDEANK